MNHQTLNRSSQYTFKKGYVTKNRIVVPPMASATAGVNGLATEVTISHYATLAKSKAGLVFVEYSYVHASGRSEENQLGAHEDSCIPGLSAIANVIHEQGSLAGLQITHAGGKTSVDLTGGALQAPSAVAVPAVAATLEVPTAMSLLQIQNWKESFIAAAVRAQNAGFEVVEVHAAHGYGLNQWLSPITNKRTDDYGGSTENRLRLLREIVEGIKATCDKLLISLRMPGRDFLEGGLEEAEILTMALALEKAGVDMLNVSSGIGGWRRPKDRVGEGFLVPEATAIQKVTNIPVIGVGGIESGIFIDELISTGTVSFVAVGRAILTQKFVALEA